MSTHHDSYVSADLVEEMDHVRSRGGSTSQHQELRSGEREGEREGEGEGEGEGKGRGRGRGRERGTEGGRERGRGGGGRIGVVLSILY